MIVNAKQLIIRLQKDVHKDLRRLCLENDISVQRFVEDFIRREIEKFKRRGRKA